jgi:hypothetical protein
MLEKPRVQATISKFQTPSSGYTVVLIRFIRSSKFTMIRWARASGPFGVV